MLYFFFLLHTMLYGSPPHVWILLLEKNTLLDATIGIFIGMQIVLDFLIMGGWKCGGVSYRKVRAENFLPLQTTQNAAWGTAAEISRHRRNWSEWPDPRQEGQAQKPGLRIPLFYFFLCYIIWRINFFAPNGDFLPGIRPEKLPEIFFFSDKSSRFSPEIP